MTILKKAFAVLTSCALMLSLAACNSEPQETIVEKPEDISDHAIVVDYLGMAVELPDAIYDRLGEQVFPTANSPAAPEGVTVNGQVLFLYQSGAVYDRVLELQSTGEAMSEAEYLTLSEQAGNLCAITSIKADTLGENNLADCTGFENNELIGELGGNSFYLSNDNLSPESLSEEDAADLQAMKDSLPELASNLVLYTPIESTAQGVEEGAVITGFSTTDLDGNAVDSSILSEAKLTVLNVWATYCTPCVNEMPDLETLSQNYKDKGVQVVGLVADVFDDEEKKTEAKEILSATGVTYVNLLPDTVLDDSLLYDITGTPTTLFLDSEGKILKIVEGTRDLDALTEMVDELLAAQE